MSREEIIGQLMEGKYGEIYQCLMNDARAFAPDALLDEVEDCLQEAFLLLYSQWPKYQNIKNLPGWLYVTAAECPEKPGSGSIGPGAKR